MTNNHKVVATPTQQGTVLSKAGFQTQTVEHSSWTISNGSVMALSLFYLLGSL